MKKTLTIFSVVLFMSLIVVPAAQAQENFGTWSGPSVSLFSPEELDNLLAPIALYPDPLIAQILPASTFMNQIKEATLFVRQYGVRPDIEPQDWAPNIKAVSHYPEILFMMDRRYEWTTSLGQAFSNQEGAVMDAIQRLRAEALAEGNLISTPQQQVIVDQGIIRIIPATPDFIYVPTYDPQVVYVETPPPDSSFIFFGSGFAIGFWLGRDFEWHNHHIEDHDLHRREWTERTQPHIRDWDEIHGHRHHSEIPPNYWGRHHEFPRNREEIHHKEQIRRDRTDRSGEENLHGFRPSRIGRPWWTRPRSHAPERFGNMKVHRGRVLKPRKLESQTGYGGYRNRRQISRHYAGRRHRSVHMQRFNRADSPSRFPSALGRRVIKRPARRSPPRRAQQKRVVRREYGRYHRR